MRVIAIDPGVRMCGFAVFDCYTLLTAGLMRDNDPDLVRCALNMYYLSRIHEYWAQDVYVVVEKMQIYDRLAQKGDLNDLLNVALVSGVLHAKLSPSLYPHITPTAREWKGTIKKVIHHERIKQRCPEAETIAQQTAKTYRHNVYDAIGLGLWALERIKYGFDIDNKR